MQKDTGTELLDLSIRLQKLIENPQYCPEKRDDLPSMEGIYIVYNDQKMSSGSAKANAFLCAFFTAKLLHRAYDRLELSIKDKEDLTAECADMLSFALGFAEDTNISHLMKDFSDEAKAIMEDIEVFLPFEHPLCPEWHF